MSRVGQISIARPGAPLQLEFDERALKRVIEEEAQPGDHVSLYPGNYTIWDEDEEIFIESGINLTVLPGAKVDYVQDFRSEDFTHDEEPVDSISGAGLRNHPLGTGSADRYLRPNFTGHVENIVDLNFGSEWAFERDLKQLRTDFEDFSDFSRFINVNVEERVIGPLEVGLGETIEFRSGQETIINYDFLPSGDGIYVEFDIDPLSTRVNKVFGGNKIQMRNSNVTGEVTIDHEELQTTGDPQNSELTFIQSLTVEDGHVVDVDANEIAILDQREPRSSEGEEGDIWFVEEGDFLRDIFLATAEPDNLEGKEGDLWFVNDQNNSERDAENVFARTDTPEPSEGENGDIWLRLQQGPGDFFAIQEVFIKQRSPSSADGDDNDIWTTLERTP